MERKGAVKGSACCANVSALRKMSRDSEEWTVVRLEVFDVRVD